jgi:hypothetical protein
MRRQIALLLPAISLAAFGCPSEPEKPATAERPALDTAEKKLEAEASADTAMLATAQGLLIYGAKNEDPTALALAAKILKQVGAAELDAEKETKAGDGEAGEKEGEIPQTAEAALEMAEALAQGDERVLEMIEEVKGMGAAKGPVGDTIRMCDTVLAHSTDVWRNLRVRSNEPLAIQVKGDGDTDLDCRLYNSRGQLVGSDLDGTDYCVMAGFVRRGGRWRLEIKNLGGVYNNYCMLIE